MEKNFDQGKREAKDRILSLINKFGISELKRGGALSKKLGVHNSVITRLIDEESFPTISNLKKICENAQVTADWLLFGEPTLGLAEAQTQNYEARPLAPIEADLLHQVELKISQVLKEKHRKLTQEQRARLLTRIYNDCAEDRSQPNALMVERYLWMFPEEKS